MEFNTAAKYTQTQGYHVVPSSPLEAESHQGPLEEGQQNCTLYTLSQAGQTRLSSVKDHGLTAGSEVSDTPSQRLLHSGSFTQAMYLVAFSAYALSGILPRKARESLVSSILPSFSCS